MISNFHLDFFMQYINLTLDFVFIHKIFMHSSFNPKTTVSLGSSLMLLAIIIIRFSTFFGFSPISLKLGPNAKKKKKKKKKIQIRILHQKIHNRKKGSIFYVPLNLNGETRRRARRSPLGRLIKEISSS